MPNHIKNRIEINGTPEQIEEMITTFGAYQEAILNLAHDGTIICRNKNATKFDVGWFDSKTGKFSQREKNDVIGLPDGWEFEITQSFLRFPDFEKVVPPPDDPAYRDQPTQDIAKDSPNWWYNWNVKNWGTKFNSYIFEKEAWNVYTFETAWSSVPNIIDIMSKGFPDIEINYKYADEDTGQNVGIYQFLNGLINSYKPKGGSKEAYDLAFELRPDCKKYYKEVAGKYEYIDE